MKAPKLITLDGDGCLFSYEKIGGEFHSAWDALGFAYGLRKSWDTRTKIYYKPATDDKKWSEENAADLIGRKVADCFKVLYPIPYCAGAREFAKLTKRKVKRGLLSPCIDLVGREVARDLKLDFEYCNILLRTNGIFTGQLNHRVYTWRKHEKLEEICKRFNVRPEEICHIGDNDNDLSVAECVGTFIALNPKTDAVKSTADYIAKDFFDVLDILREAGIKGIEAKTGARDRKIKTGSKVR